MLIHFSSLENYGTVFVVNKQTTKILIHIYMVRIHNRPSLLLNPRTISTQMITTPLIRSLKKLSKSPSTIRCLNYNIRKPEYMCIRKPVLLVKGQSSKCIILERFLLLFKNCMCLQLHVSLCNSIAKINHTVLTYNTIKTTSVFYFSFLCKLFLIFIMHKVKRIQQLKQ